jgi:hypothetical protein
VVPISLGGTLQDPFLLLAHHKHWFDPRDPLREPFKNAGKLLGLPYVDVEGYVAVFTCDVACVLFEVTAFILTMVLLF